MLISVKDTWKHVASVRYNEKLGKWRKKYGKDAKPNSVPQDVLEQMVGILEQRRVQGLILEGVPKSPIRESR